MTGPVLLTFLSTFGTTSKSPHPSGLVPLSSQPRKPGWSVDLVWLFLSVDSWCASFTTRHYTVPFPIAQYSTSRRPPDPHPAIPQPAPTNQHWRTRPSQPAQHSTTQQQHSQYINSPAPLCTLVYKISRVRTTLKKVREHGVQPLSKEFRSISRSRLCGHRPSN